MDTERDSALLLLAMYQQANGSTQEYIEVDQVPGWGELGDDRLITLTGHLRDAHMVEMLEVPSGMTCRITSQGVIKAEQLLRDRDRPVIRYDMALNGLIAATTDEFPKHRLEVQQFLLSGNARVLDTVLTIDEISRAIEFLEEEKLVTVERDDGGPIAITLTPRGRRCGWTEKVDVQGFLAGQQPSRIQQNWHVTINGGAPQMGQGNVQHNTFGYDPAQVSQLVRELNGLIPSMDVPEPVREQISEDVEALEREAAREDPQPARIRRLLERVQESLAPATALDVATSVAAILGH
ncbi:hypothetical protein [Streptomyces sp. NPDC086989]|uniref:hypothetical protein n=1 Tax=Streptomyces sp. NPDC086989 TaxID=3365764 RepID=UPI0037FA165C